MSHGDRQVVSLKTRKAAITKESWEKDDPTKWGKKENAGNMLVISMFLEETKTMSKKIWVKNRQKEADDPNHYFKPVLERITKDTVATGHYRLRY